MSEQWRVPFLAVALALTASRVAAAPPDPLLRVGSLMRVQSDTGSEPVKGTLVGVDEKALKLATIGWSLTVPVETIRKAEVRVGRRRRILEGLALGMGVGALISQAWEVDPRQCGGDTGTHCSRGAAVLGGMAAYGALGAGVGATIKKDRWAPLDVRAAIEQARVARLAAPDPAALLSRPEALRPGQESEGAPCSTVAAADRVRVIAPTIFQKPAVGYFLGSDAAALQVVYAGQTMRVPRDSVTRFERSARRSRRIPGMKVGAGIGVVAGVVTSIVLDGRASEGRRGGHGGWLGHTYFGYVGAFPGALLGAALAPGERWVEEDLSRVCVERTASEDPNGPRRVRVGIAPVPGGGLGVRLSVGF